MCALMMLCGCTLLSCKAEDADGRPKIVCTTFVLADWTREVLGDDADNFKLELLGANGADIHSYQPTVRDISLLSRCEVFIHIGGESDAWTDGTLSSAANYDMCTIDIAHELGDSLCENTHSHGGHEHESGEHHFDEHIWFSFEHTRDAVSAIAYRLGERYPDKKDMYESNADAYKDRISELEGEYSDAAEAAATRDVIVADRYPFAYLFDRLGINAYAAYEGCSAESEASFEVIARLSCKIDELGISYVLMCEDSNGKIAEAVINNARTGRAQVLSLNSLQSQGRRELERGVSYLSVMRDNLNVIKKAIS